MGTHCFFSLSPKEFFLGVLKVDAIIEERVEVLVDDLADASLTLPGGTIHVIAESPGEDAQRKMHFQTEKCIYKRRPLQKTRLRRLLDWVTHLGLSLRRSRGIEVEFIDHAEWHSVLRPAEKALMIANTVKQQ